MAGTWGARAAAWAVRRLSRAPFDRLRANRECRAATRPPYADSFHQSLTQSMWKPDPDAVGTGWLWSAMALNSP